MNGANATSSKGWRTYAAVGLAVFILMWILGLLPFFFGVLIPYAAVATFILGFLYKVMRWASSPVPFRIPTTCGQQKTLDFIHHDKLEAPHTFLQCVGRMLVEILFFRSLFRNTKAEMRSGPYMIYGSNKVLWVAAMAFHWSFLIIFLRHLRFFTEPVPSPILWLQDFDSMFQVGLPAFFITDGLILAGLGYLLWRRYYDPKIRYISLPADYFALFLLLGIVLTGILVRHVFKVDIVAVKELAVGWFALSFHAPVGIGFWFYVHLFLVSTLLAYFPFSKLMHMPGVFLSPTRNLANNSREKRHVNPWNYPVKVHTYEEYEEEFHDKMKAAGLPLEKE